MVALGMPSAHDHWSSNFRLTSTTFPQIGRAVEGFLDRVARHCSENHADPDDSCTHGYSRWPGSVSFAKLCTSKSAI